MKPVTYPEGRKCPKCKRTLSIYNKGPRCNSHDARPDQNNDLATKCLCSSPELPIGLKQVRQREGWN